MKRYYYLLGLPRAGNTLFASLLNQNKDIAVTANSPTVELMGSFNNVVSTLPTVRNFPDYRGIDNVRNNFYDLYFQHYPQKYILDRAPLRLYLLNNFQSIIKNKVKIIILWRDLFEVLASFLSWSEKHFTNMFGDMKDHAKKIDFLLDPEQGNLPTQLSIVREYSEYEYLDIVHYVKYDDLVNDTENTINKVYDFLNIPRFKHRFDNLNQLELNNTKYIDEGIFGKGLHTIRTDVVKKRDYDYMKYIPKESYEKYKHLNFVPYSNL